MLEETIISHFKEQKDVAAVYIYGSHAKGKERPDSDVDVAILLDPYNPKTERAKRVLYMTELSRLTRKVIHPVILNSAGEGLLKQILGKGQCIQVNDPNALSRFRMTAIARIADYGYYRQIFERGVIRKIMGGVEYG